MAYLSTDVPAIHRVSQKFVEDALQEFKIMSDDSIWSELQYSEIVCCIIIPRRQVKFVRIPNVAIIESMHSLSVTISKAVRGNESRTANLGLLHPSHGYFQAPNHSSRHPFIQFARGPSQKIFNRFLSPVLSISIDISPTQNDSPCRSLNMQQHEQGLLYHPRTL